MGIDDGELEKAVAKALRGTYHIMVSVSAALFIVLLVVMGAWQLALAMAQPAPAQQGEMKCTG